MNDDKGGSDSKGVDEGEEKSDRPTAANIVCAFFLRSKRFNVTEDEIKSFVLHRVLFKAIQEGEKSEEELALINKLWTHPAITSLNGGTNNPLVNAAEQGNVEMCRRL